MILSVIVLMIVYNFDTVQMQLQETLLEISRSLFILRGYPTQKLSNFDNFPTWLSYLTKHFFLSHFLKSVRIRSFSGPYFPLFGPKKGKMYLKKLCISKFFTQCPIWVFQPIFQSLTQLPTGLFLDW